MSGRPSSLRRELVVWYSVVLLVALVLFSALTYLILSRSLARTGAESLRQTAATAEQLLSRGIPAVASMEEPVPAGEGNVQAIRRRTRLVTGEVLEIYVARSGDVERTALRSFLWIVLALVPLTAVGAALGGRVLADRLLRPLDRLVRATREVEIGMLARRVEEPERPAELRELASAFNAMLERLERAVDSLRRFSADASHELRTPLTAIRGTVEVALSRARSAEELRETLEEVAEETEGLLALVEGLLTLARGEAAGRDAPTAPVELAVLLEEAAELGRALATGKDLVVEVRAPEDLTVPGDAVALRQVFVNLVANAVKFTPSGRVSIDARPEGDGGAVVEVRDTGIGIAAAELPRVFDRFYRGDAARSRPGSGLGLPIAGMIVERHGGSVTADSTPGEGAVFRVRLPGGVPRLHD